MIKVNSFIWAFVVCLDLVYLLLISELLTLGEW